MSQPIYVLIDHGDGQVRTASWETLAMGRAIADQTGAALFAVVLGWEVEQIASQASTRKVDGVILVENEKLAEYDPDAYSAALKSLLSEDRPAVFLAAHSYQNIDMMPRLSAALGTALVTDCIRFRKEGEELRFVRQMFRNKVEAEIKVNSPAPWIVTMQAGAFSTDGLQGGQAQITSRPADLQTLQFRRRQLERIAGGKGKVDLTKAEVIVGIGRGVKKQENLKLVEELAEVLGAEIGASRPVVDNEWLDRERQIGSSGQTVSPRLYIALGISGAIQHVVGMKSSNCIVAVNTDPNAPIFNIARYGIVGDLAEIVPALTRRIRETAGS